MAHGAFQSIGLSPMTYVRISTSESFFRSGTGWELLSSYGRLGPCKVRALCVLGTVIRLSSTVSVCEGFALPTRNHRRDNDRATMTAVNGSAPCVRSTAGVMIYMYMACLPYLLGSH